MPTPAQGFIAALGNMRAVSCPCRISFRWGFRVSGQPPDLGTLTHTKGIKMKLAELLRNRSTLQTKGDELVARILNNVRSTDGESPSESSAALLIQLDEVYDELAHLVETINQVNVIQRGSDGASLSVLLTRRELLGRKIKVRKKAAQKAVDRDYHNEGRFVRNIDVATMYAEAESLSIDMQRVDAEIQQLNWSIEVVA